MRDRLARVRLQTLEGRDLPSLSSLPCFPLPSAPAAVLAADLNGDGKIDLVTAGTSASGAVTWSVLLGKGPGRFAAARTLPAPRADTTLLAVGDFTGDHKLDLVSGNDRGVLVYPGKGFGTFAGPRLTQIGHLPGSFAVGDFNGDGKLDLAVGYLVTVNDPSRGPVSVPGGVDLLLGKGNGTFAAPRHLSSLVTGSPLAADLNGDGKLDLVASGPLGLYSLLGKGNGTFAAPHHLPAPRTCTPEALADLNGDHRPDLVITSPDRGRVGVLLGNGRVFAFPHYFSSGKTPVRQTLVGDFFGDGRPDVAVLTGAGVGVLKNLGRGILAAPHFYGTGGDPVALAVGRGKGDRRDELAVADAGSQDVGILLVSRSGTFAAPLVTDTGLGSNLGTVAVAAGDFNQDGTKDLVVSGGATGRLAVLLGNGKGAFTVRGVSLNASQVYALQVGDFNGDGRADVAAAVALPGDNGFAVLVLPGQGDGRFGPAGTFLLPTAGFSLSSLVVGDFNGDHRTDLAVGTDDGVDVLLGNGDGTFRPGPILAESAGQVVSADLDGDHRTDLVAQAEGGVNVYLGQAGGPAAPIHVSLQGQVAALLVGDVNGDGKPDLVAALYDEDRVAVLLGKGNGTFGAPRYYAAGNGPVALALGDFNGDRKPDLAVADQGGAELTLLAGLGLGRFAAPHHLAGPSEPAALAAVDLDRNGTTDLAVANEGGGVVSLLNG